jgi:hypothetical protein
MLKRKPKRKRMSKWLAIFLISISLLSFSMIPTNAYAVGDAGVIAVLTTIFNWAKGAMMREMQKFQQSQTDELKNKAENIFEKKSHWESWPASLRELAVEQGVKLEGESNQISYKNVKDFLSYTQGKASGVDASKHPAQVVAYFNKRYNYVQNMSSSCQLNAPQPVGDSNNNCTPAQTQFTNYLITGIHPMPSFPKDATQTATGQQYKVEKKVSDTRTALAQLALNQASNTKTNTFIHYMQKNLKNPSIDQVNQESPAAVGRDTLILNKARAMIALKQYEISLTETRLLATIVSQNEDVHLQHIRALAQDIH